MKKGQHRKQRLKYALCSIFASAVIASGCSATAEERSQNTPYDGATPDLIDAFGEKASPAPQSQDPREDIWNEMEEHQDHYMQDTQDAGEYVDFLAQFDNLKGESLNNLAQDVNSKVEKEISYHSDQEVYQQDEYWAAPIETVMNGKGDCEDYAILQYYILRDLGVPESRLAVAVVNSQGLTDRVDHAILLMNIARDGQAPKWVVLNDGGPVRSEADYVGSHPASPKNYVFYDARNEDNYWATRYGNNPSDAPSRSNAFVLAPKLKFG